MFVQEEPWLMLFVLFCFSVCVEPASAEDDYCVLFSHARAGTRGVRRSLITPSLAWPRFLTLHQFTPRLHRLPFAPARAIYGSALQWIGTQRSRWICECYSRWDSCGVMDVSTRPCGLHKRRCMCAPLILACVVCLPRDVSVNTHNTYASCCL